MFKRYTYVEGLTNLIDNNEGVLINILGQVKDKYGNDLMTMRDAQDHKTVNVQSWDGKRNYRVIDLVALQFKSLMIPKDKYGKVIAFVIDGNKENTHAENIGYRFEGGKLEVGDQPGFYYIPGFTAYAISINGILFSNRTKKIINWYKTKPQIKKNITGGYSINNVWYGFKTFVALSCHRALCLVFKEYPDNVDKMTVNHKNGVPGDDWLDNLEWATRGENNLHAYVNDLKNQHKRVLVRDVRTGEVIEYYSISECARQLGYPSGATIEFRLNKASFSQVFEDGKQFKLKSDTRGWIIPEDPETAIKEARISVSVHMRNCNSMVENRFIKINDASAISGINRQTIQWRIKKNNLTPLFGYQFKHIDDTSPWTGFTPAELHDSFLPSSFPIDCRNHLTGETISFDSVNLAVPCVGNTHIAAVLRRGEQPLLPNGWQIKFVDQEWEEFEDFEKEIYSRTKDIMARDEITGKIIIADSARSMAQDLLLEPKAMRKAALTRGNKIYHGYRFRLGISSDPWPTTILP